MHDLVKETLEEHQQVVAKMLALESVIVSAGALCAEALRQGNRIYLCGNGGSAADAQHIAAELIGRFVNDRRSLPAVALTTDTSALTAIGNDYGYDSIFQRQVQGLAQPGDLVIGYSTSGNSKNVINAVSEAKKVGCKVVTLTGKGGGALAEISDIDLCVDSSSTARIQEAHAFLGHALCSAIDEL